MITINDATKNPLAVVSGQALTAFSAITVADTAPLGNTETVAVVLSPPQYSYPTVTDVGKIADTNGGGTINGTTFVESGLDTGTSTFASTLLNRLVYAAPTLSNGQSAVVVATVSATDGSSGNVFTDAPIVIDVVTAPLISGTTSDEPVASGDSISPFATTNVTDTDFGSYYINGQYNQGAGAQDSATITITDGGKATDADGLLTGPGLSKTGVGTYSLFSQSYNITSLLRGLKFATTHLAAGPNLNLKFELDVTDTKANLTSKDGSQPANHRPPAHACSTKHRAHLAWPNRGPGECS